MDQSQIYKQIEDYAYGKLQVSEIEDLWVKILENPELLSYLETVAHLKYLSSSQSSANTRIPSKTRISPYKNGFWALAASMIIIIGVIFYFQLFANRITLEAQGVVPPSDYESIDVYRSMDNHLTPHQQELNKGFALMISNKNDQAISVFQHLVKENPDNDIQAKLFFDLGAIAYNHKQFTTALDDFRLALPHTQGFSTKWLPEKINWYLGQTYLQLEQPQKATEFFNRVVQYNGYYRDRADSLLSKLQ